MHFSCSTERFKVSAAGTGLVINGAGFLRSCATSPVLTALISDFATDGVPLDGGLPIG